jgi:hypothetical protein
MTSPTVAMRWLSLVGLVALAAVPAGCSKERCGRGDWCSCSNGTVCNQGCDDVDGCRIFCDHMVQCGATCGNDCNFEFHDATDSVVTCGDGCHISCHDGDTCTITAAARGDLTCYAMKQCTVEVGTSSQVSCATVETCAVACSGDCRVFCADDVQGCDVSCTNGAAPTACADGSLACGPC